LLDFHQGISGGIAIALSDGAMLTRLFDGATGQVTRGLAFAQRRHDVLVENLANVETAGYKGRDLVFENHLGPLLRRVTADLPGEVPVASLHEPRPRLVYADDGPVKPNGNDVQADRQMARLAENTLFHHALVQILIGRFASLKQAISGRL
jgi:flagellar basal-body rod protein FlgB